jgi:hypothetical protein
MRTHFPNIYIQGTHYWALGDFTTAVPVSLPGIDTRPWNRMLASWCEEHAIPFATPCFTLLNWATWDGDIAIFSYGMAFLDEAAKSIEGIVGFEDGYSDDTEFNVIEGEWFSYDIKNTEDPVLLGYFRTEGAFAYFIGITSFIFISEDILTFDLDLPMRAQWDPLLKVQCDRFGLPWQKPKFHLVARHWY